MAKKSGLNLVLKSFLSLALLFYEKFAFLATAIITDKMRRVVGGGGELLSTRLVRVLLVFLGSSCKLPFQFSHSSDDDALNESMGFKCI